jgi:predicted site-specific integrase-resolvase
LHISDTTLRKYRREGLIKAKEYPNGFFDYDDESVYQFLNKGIERMTFLYARVSSPNQEEELESQINILKQFALSSGFSINGIFSDIASGASFEKRDEFFRLFKEVIHHKVGNIIILSKDRLSRVAFNLLSYLFDYYGTRIIVISQVNDPKIDSVEMFEEIFNILDNYSTSLLDKRKKNILQQQILRLKESIDAF